MKMGKVYLLGAGPGHPDLLTVRAMKTLRKADVVVYDRLVEKAILKLIPKKARKIYVGKCSGRHAIPQNKIDEILVDEARKGGTVVRLKSGDPFTFGRGGEEAQRLRKAGIPFEIVPGITSALAVPAYAGIPVTHREYASSVAIVTGHEDPTKLEDRVRWSELAASVDTIVVLMGVRSLETIAKGLIEGGRNGQTDIAIIERGTTRRQRTTIGTLSTIAERARRNKVKPPAVIVVGEVVRLGKELAWFKS